MNTPPNILRPALSRGEIQVIGATHPHRVPQIYRKGLRLGTPLPACRGGGASLDEAVEISKGSAPYYEDSIVWPSVRIYAGWR